MNSTLIDAGPLIALFDRDDRYHPVVTTFLESYAGRLITTWPVITETAHMLDFDVRVQVDFFEWIRRQAVYLFPLETRHVDRIRTLIRSYANVPMDLADASLVVVAEQMGVTEILTLDSDFTIYRTASGGDLTHLLASLL